MYDVKTDKLNTYPNMFLFNSTLHNVSPVKQTKTYGDNYYLLTVTVSAVVLLPWIYISRVYIIRPN